MFFVVGIVLSTLEALGGVLIEKLFGTVFWNYSQQKFHIGHYISLEMTLVWGVASVIFIYIIHPLLKGLIKKIPVWLTILLIILFLMDCTMGCSLPSPGSARIGGRRFFFVIRAILPPSPLCDTVSQTFPVPSQNRNRLFNTKAATQAIPIFNFKQ